MIRFTADTHFHHGNIIGYTNRPFKNSAHMDATMLKNLIEVVKPEDTTYFIGDFTILNTNRWQPVEQIINKIPGKKELILGNHDYFKPDKYIDMGFWAVHTHLEIIVEGQRFMMAHDPAKFCLVPKECIFLCGHIHNLFKVLKKERTINVGVDVWDFKPIDVETILEALK